VNVAALNAALRSLTVYLDVANDDVIISRTDTTSGAKFVWSVAK
jgi:hypothetical protein